MGGTGNTGPPETDLEGSLGTILSVDLSAPAENRRTAPTRRGRPQIRPVILDPQPITRRRSPLTDQERAETVSALDLDRPVRDVTYRQERRTLTELGQEVRESSMTESRQRRNAPTPRAASAAAATVSGISSSIQAMSSQKSNMEALVLHNWQVREQERDKDREERREKAALEKEERERKEKTEKEERERRDLREERRLSNEREEKDRVSLLMFKLLGHGQDSKKDKVIKVVAKYEDTGSQPLPIKLKLSSLMALKKDLCDYMNESEIDGIVLEEQAGDQAILTDIEQIDTSQYSSFSVSKLFKRGKSYFKLVST